MVGEVVGGSVREERYDVLSQKLKDNNLEEKDYWWYMDLRKYGTVPHGGFGLGFERLIMLTTGVENIRDWLAFSQLSGAGFWIQFRGVFRRIIAVNPISKQIELKSLKTRY